MAEPTSTGDREETSEAQVRDLIQQIADGAKIGRAVAARRVPRERLGEELALWVALVENTLAANLGSQASRAEVAGAVWQHADRDFPIDGQTVDALAWRGAPGSLAEADLAAWHADGWPAILLQPSHQQDRGPVMHLTRRIVEAALDHLRGIAVLLADRRIVRPPLALARVVLDGAAHAFYLLEPEISANDRLLRALNEVLARAGEDYNQAVRDNDADSIKRTEEEIGNVIDAVGSRCPANWKKSRRGTPFLGTQPVSTGKMVRRLLDGGSPWNLLSGVIHLKEDEGWRLMLGAYFESPHRDSYVALHTLGALIGITRMFEALAPYTGWDLTNIEAANGSFLRIWADASGMFDDEHRASVRPQGAE